MTQQSTTSDPRSAAIGPGRLVLVVGPSGAGKDTLLKLAQSVCADDSRIVFPRRWITREASASEDNEQISPDTFRQACEKGDFAMHWEAHGHGYGIPRSINSEISAGHTVVVNVSRGIVDQMRRIYADVTVVSVTAPLEVLEYRLALRARSSDGQLVERLTRTADGSSVAPDVIISNVGAPEDHAKELVRIIRRQ
jgi:ribose 1,5-bisphosphokinase